MKYSILLVILLTACPAFGQYGDSLNGEWWDGDTLCLEADSSGVALYRFMRSGRIFFDTLVVPPPPPSIGQYISALYDKYVSECAEYRLVDTGWRISDKWEIEPEPLDYRSWLEWRKGEPVFFKSPKCKPTIEGFFKWLKSH